MRTGFTFLALVSAAFIILSCNKDVDNTTAPIDNDTLAISQFIRFGAGGAPAGFDTSIIANFYYDNQKRRSSFDYLNLTSAGDRFYHHYLYSYSGNEKLPYKVVITYGPARMEKNEVYISYNNNFIIKDSTLAYGPTGAPSTFYINEYTTLNNNRFLRKHFVYSYTGSRMLKDSIIYTRSFNEKNVVSKLDSVWTKSGSSMGLLKVTAAQYVYDNKINPFLKHYLPSLGYYENPNVQFFYGLGPNNAVSGKIDNLFPAPVTQQNWSMRHEYNEQNYPVVERSESTNVRHALFFYMRL